MNPFTLGYFYIKDPDTGEVIKSESTSDNAIMEMPKNCRWLDPGRYLQWFGDMLVNDEGKFLIADFAGESEFCVMFSCLMFYQQGEIQPKNDDLIATIPQWGPEYEVSMEVFVDSNTWSTSSTILLFRAKPDKDCCDEGHRVPCIYVHPANSHKILIATQIQNSNWIGEEGNAHTYLNIGDESRWITLHLSQTSTDVSSLNI